MWISGVHWQDSRTGVSRVRCQTAGETARSQIMRASHGPCQHVMWASSYQEREVGTYPIIDRKPFNSFKPGRGYDHISDF